jgi:hypothetical protein
MTRVPLDPTLGHDEAASTRGLPQLPPSPIPCLPFGLPAGACDWLGLKRLWAMASRRVFSWSRAPARTTARENDCPRERVPERARRTPIRSLGPEGKRAGMNHPSFLIRLYSRNGSRTTSMPRDPAVSGSPLRLALGRRRWHLAFHAPRLMPASCLSRWSRLPCVLRFATLPLRLQP